MDSKNIHPAGQKAQAPRFTRQLVAHTNGFKVWLKETDADTIGRFVAEREADDQGVVWAMFCEIQKAWNAHDTLLAAAKTALRESADLISDTILSAAAHQELTDAVEEAGGWTEEERAELDSLALGENVPEPSEADIADMTDWANEEARARADEEEGRRDAALRAEEEAITHDPEEP